MQRIDIFRDRIKAELKARGWKREDLAAKTGYSKGIINLVLQNYRRFNEDQVLAIANALDLDPFELFTFNDFIKLKGKIPEEEMRMVKEMVETMLAIPEIKMILVGEFQKLKMQFEQKIKIETSKKKSTLTL